MYILLLCLNVPQNTAVKSFVSALTLILIYLGDFVTCRDQGDTYSSLSCGANRNKVMTQFKARPLLKKC